MRKLILCTSVIIMLATMMSSCQKSSSGTDYSLGFVSEYYSPERIVSRQQVNLLEIEIYGQGSQRYYSGTDEYLELARKRGDTKFKKELLPSENPALTVDPTSVSVICSSDIDDNHPAGNPLDDIVLMLGYTYSEYVNSGYKKYTEELSDTYGYVVHTYRFCPGHSPFFKFLKDLVPSDLVFMSSRFSLYFPDEFWPAGEYDLTITITGEGYRLSETVTYVAG